MRDANLFVCPFFENIKILSKKFIIHPSDNIFLHRFRIVTHTHINMEFFDEFYAIMNAYAAPFMKMNKKIKIVALACLCVLAIEYIRLKLPLLKQFLMKKKQPKNSDENSSYYGEENETYQRNYPIIEGLSLEEQYLKLDQAQEIWRQPIRDSQQFIEINNDINNNKLIPLKEYAPRNS